MERTAAPTAEPNAHPDPLRRTTGLSLDEFATRHWGSAPLHRTAAQLEASDFADLLTLDAVDELISERGLRTPFMRMSRDGDVLSPSRFTRSGGAGAEIADQVADDRVLAEFAAGATIVLQGLHRLWPPLQRFALDLTTQLGHPVQINAYITPPANVGFSPHYDVHDVFVLQFAGRKRWRIHEPVWPAPLRDQPWDARRAEVTARAAESPMLDLELGPGDALYLPRGYIHSALSLGEISAHLTIGVHPLTRKTIADEVFAALARDAALRQALPPGVDLSSDAAIDAELDATIGALRGALDRLDRSAIARGIGRHLRASTRPAPVGPLAQFNAAATLTSDDRVRLRPGLRVTLRDEGTRTILELPDGEVPLEPSHASSVSHALSGIPVSANTLPGLDPGDGLQLLARLLRAGVVVPI